MDGSIEVCGLFSSKADDCFIRTCPNLTHLGWGVFFGARWRLPVRGPSVRISLFHYIQDRYLDAPTLRQTVGAFFFESDVYPAWPSARRGLVSAEDAAELVVNIIYKWKMPCYAFAHRLERPQLLFVATRLGLSL